MSTVVSLQSVGLGTFYVARSIDRPVYVPLFFGVGGKVDDLRGGFEKDSNGQDITIKSIKYWEKDEAGIGFNHYQVETSDGHTRVLPADKYIAEYKEQK